MAPRSNSEEEKRSSAKAVVSWEGDSREVLLAWPKEVRVDFGHSIHEMQEGRLPLLDARRMATVGEGVFELKTGDSAKWYRLMYLARVGNVIYVLDCFEKDSRKTEAKDLNRSKMRLQKVRQRLMEERRHAKG